MPLKQRGFCDFPISSSWTLWVPVALELFMMVTLLILCDPELVSLQQVPMFFSEEILSRARSHRRCKRCPLSIVLLQLLYVLFPGILQLPLYQLTNVLLARLVDGCRTSLWIFLTNPDWPWMSLFHWGAGEKTEPFLLSKAQKWKHLNCVSALSNWIKYFLTWHSALCQFWFFFK